MKIFKIIITMLLFGVVTSTAQSDQVYESYGVKLHPKEVSIQFRTQYANSSFGHESNFGRRRFDDHEGDTNFWFVNAMWLKFIPVSSTIPDLRATIGLGGLIGLQTVRTNALFSYGLLGSIGIDYRVPKMPLNVSLDLVPRLRWGEGSTESDVDIKTKSTELSMIHFGIRIKLNNIFDRIFK